MRRSGYYDAAPLIQWRAIFGGLVIGLAVLTLLSALWAALGFGARQTTFSSNFQWWVAGSAIFAMFLGAYCAALFSSVRGMGAGLANALTLWGLSVLTVILVGIPAVMRMFDLRWAFLRTATVGSATAATGTSPHTALWTAFWAIVIGLGAALLGGLIGGAMPRALYVAEPMAYEEPRAVVRRDRDYRRTGTE
jgi:hypothetical protein